MNALALPLLTPLVFASCASPSTVGAAPSDQPALDSPAVADLEFLAGRWVGEAFGGVAEEVWNPPLGGQMLGTFRLVKDGEPSFSEHMLLMPLEDGVVLRLKHFHPDLEGWEEKGESLDFELEEVRGTTARFKGLTFAVSGDQLVISLTMGSSAGPRVETMRFSKQRQ